MSRTKRFLGGVTLGYVNQGLVTVVGLWLTPFLLRHIGQHDYGLWLVGAQLLAYLSLMDLGVVALLPRATAYATGRAGRVVDAKDLPEVIGQTTWLVLLQTPVVAVVGSILWFTIPAAWGPLRIPIAIVILSFVLAFPLRIFGAVLQGLQDLVFLGKLSIFSWLTGTATSVVLVIAGKGLYAVAIGWVVMQLTTTSICFWRLRRNFEGVLPDRLPSLSWLAARSQLRQGFWVSVNQVAVAILGGADVLIIGKLLGPAAVVPYVCTGKLVAVLSNQPQMLTQLAIPALAELRTSGAREDIARASVALSHAMLLLSGGVLCTVLVVNRGFVGWWVGAEQFIGSTLTSVLLLVMLLRHWNLTVSVMLFSFGGERRLALTALFDGFVTLVASVLLTKWIGLMGAPLGSIIGVCLVSLPVNLASLSTIDALLLSHLLKSLVPWLWRFALLAFVAGLLARRFVPDTFAALTAASAIACVAYVAVMLPLAWRDPLGAYVRPRLAPLWLRLSRTA